MSALHQHLEASTVSRPFFDYVPVLSPFSNVRTTSPGGIGEALTKEVAIQVITQETPSYDLHAPRPSCM